MEGRWSEGGCCGCGEGGGDHITGRAARCSDSSVSDLSWASLPELPSRRLKYSLASGSVFEDDNASTMVPMASWFESNVVWAGRFGGREITE